ncbi:hypothetical protein SRABI112_05357 [Pseudomonas mediterranea]|nr:hypothetical protein SRABI112_05357 [Pseudomonas mediterranea]
MLIALGRRRTQVAFAEQPSRQRRYPGVLFVRLQQGTCGHRLPFGQGLLPLLGIKHPQVAVKVQARARLVKGCGQVVQTGGGNGQDHRLAVLGLWTGLPHRLEAVLGQIAETQFVQGLQIALADGDIDTVRTQGRIGGRQAVAGRVQSVIGQLLQLDPQGHQPFVVRPDCLAGVLLVERLQAQHRRKVDTRGQRRASHR